MSGKLAPDLSKSLHSSVYFNLGLPSFNLTSKLLFAHKYFLSPGICSFVRCTTNQKHKSLQYYHFKKYLYVRQKTTLNLLYTFWNLKQKKDILNYLFFFNTEMRPERKTKKTLYIKCLGVTKRGNV